MKKNIIIGVALVILLISGAMLIYVLNDNNCLFKAYLKDNGDGYTLIIKNNKYLSFKEKWNIKELEKDGHFMSMPWTLDSRASKITHVSIEDEIKVDSLALWFYDLQNLESIDGLEKIDTSNLNNLSATFYNCKKLESLDLSTFNTNNVVFMDYTFGNCEKLSAIYIGKDWNTKNVTNSENMFKDCFSLVGQNGTKYYEYATDKSVALVDTEDTAGYLSRK